MKPKLLKIVMGTALLLTACNGLSNKEDDIKDKGNNQQAVETSGEDPKPQDEQINEEQQEDDGVNLAAEFLNDIKVEDGVNYIQNPENIVVLVNKETAFSISLSNQYSFNLFNHDSAKSLFIFPPVIIFF